MAKQKINKNEMVLCAKKYDFDVSSEGGHKAVFWGDDKYFFVGKYNETRTQIIDVVSGEVYNCQDNVAYMGCVKYDITSLKDFVLKIGMEVPGYKLIPLRLKQENHILFNRSLNFDRKEGSYIHKAFFPKTEEVLISDVEKAVVNMDKAMKHSLAFSIEWEDKAKQYKQIKETQSEEDLTR